MNPEVAISESTAIVEYILSSFPSAPGGTRLIRTPADKDYGTYLQWFHYANGSIQPNISRQMTVMLAGISETNAGKLWRGKFFNQVRMVDEHLSKNQWFAGDQLSAADCMMMFSFSTMRGFWPYNLTDYPNVLRWMKDVSERPAYKRANEKGDYGMEPMIQPITRKFTEFPGFKDILEKVKL